MPSQTLILTPDTCLPVLPPPLHHAVLPLQPEGFAVAFSAYTSVGVMMCGAIAMHNIPEGLVRQQLLGLVLSWHVLLPQLGHVCLYLLAFSLDCCRGALVQL